MPTKVKRYRMKIFLALLQKDASAQLAAMGR
jgi:hypothetical protein